MYIFGIQTFLKMPKPNHRSEFFGGLGGTTIVTLLLTHVYNTFYKAVLSLKLYPYDVFKNKWNPFIMTTIIITTISLVVIFCLQTSTDGVQWTIFFNFL